MTSPENPFEASASALGYLYQLRVALHRCVEFSRTSRSTGPGDPDAVRRQVDEAGRKIAARPKPW